MKKLLKIAVILIALGAAVQTVVSIANADPHAQALHGEGGGQPGI